MTPLLQRIKNDTQLRGSWCKIVYCALVNCIKCSTSRTIFNFDVLVFYNTSPPRMFLSLDFLWEYRIQHGANGPLYDTPSYSNWIFCRGVSGFATDCPCGVWCRGLTTCLLHVGPPFGNRILKQQLGCRFDIMDNEFFFGVLTYAIIYVLIHQIILRFHLLKYSLFFQVLLY